MKTNKVRLSIPQPCHEDWNKMTPKEQGSFCGSCSKVVVDFTKMSDREIIDYLGKTKDQKTCGRFTKFQIGREMSSTQPSTPMYVQLKNLVFGAILSLGLPGLIKAERPVQNANPSVLRDLDIDLLPSQITGKVIDENGSAISFVIVTMFDKQGVVLAQEESNNKGEFTFELKKKIEWNNVTIQADALNYHSKTISVKQAKNNLISLLYNHEAMHTLGDVIMEDMHTSPQEADTPKIITGSVLDEYGEPLPFANVWIKATETGAISDIDGVFTLEIPKELQTEEVIQIQTSLIGFETQNSEVELQSVKKIPPLNIVMPYADQILMGLIIHTPTQQIKSPSSFDENYQEPLWKEEGFNSRKEYIKWKEEN